LTVVVRRVYTEGSLPEFSMDGRGGMPLDPRLLEILICPACRGELEAVGDDSGLECQRCGRVYPIRNGIPVMLVDEASAPTREEGDR